MNYIDYNKALFWQIGVLMNHCKSNKTYGISRKLLALLLVLCLFVTGCSSDDTSDQPQTDSAAADSQGNTDSSMSVQNTYEQYTTFSEFTDALFRENITLSTLNLHYTLAQPENYGITDYKVALSNQSVVDFSTTKQQFYDYLCKLKSFDYNSLTKDEQLVYDILVYDLEQEYNAADLQIYKEPLSPTIGDNAQIPILLAEYTFYDEQDIQDYLTLLTTVPAYFEDIMKLEKMKSEQGLFMSDTTAEAIIDQCREFIKNPESNYLISSFTERIEKMEGISETQKAEYIAANKEHVLQSVIPAYEALINGLTELKGTGKNQTGGLANLPDGKRYYQYLVAGSTGCDMTVAELKKQINTRVTSDLRQIVSMASSDPDALSEIEETVFPITEPNACLEDLQQKILSDFPEGPKTHYEIKFVSEDLKEHLSPAFYLTPPIDAAADNVIYINQGKSYQTEQTLYTTLAHEGYPGHLYQTTYFLATDPALVRNLLNYPGYVEGWATYVECLAYDYSGVDTFTAEVFRLNTSYSLGLYCLVDIGVNEEGWTLEDTVAFLKGYGITDESAVKEIFDSMVAEPANYLSYYVGYLQFMNLRDMMKEKQGDDFSLKAFHQAVLDIGPAPFSIIEKYLNQG